MGADRWRLAACIAISLVAGAFFGRPFLVLSLGLLAFLFWHYRALAGFLDYARHGADDNVPNLPGVVNELIREFNTLRDLYRQREEMLTDLLARFREAATALPDAVVVAGSDGRIEWANTRAAQYFGIRWPDDVGQYIVNLVRHPDLVEVLQRQPDVARQDVVEVPSPQDENLQLEVRISMYGNGRCMLVARDITELQRLNRMRRDFIANASHELRSPLTVVSGYLEAIEEDIERCPPEWKGKVAQMRSQAARMQRLIDDLLQLSSLESAPEHSPMDDVAVPDLAESICRAARAMEGGAALEITLEADPELWLKGSQRDLYSAFSNVVFNAVQYTPAGGSVHVRWARAGSGAVFEVRDTGEGIAAEHIPRLTERFYRVDQSRSRERGGTGLGLAIVKHALARHEATLEVESRPGQGSLFRCRFPAHRVLVRTGAASASG
jgi:two-component system phosphate regulon sensor histidine kinase PhoR